MIRGVGVVLIAALLCITSGCAKETILYKTQYQDVYIPVPCEIVLPARPHYEADPVLATYDIIEYARAVEIAAGACVKKEADNVRN